MCVIKPFITVIYLGKDYPIERTKLGKKLYAWWSRGAARRGKPVALTDFFGRIAGNGNSLGSLRSAFGHLHSRLYLRRPSWLADMLQLIAYLLVLANRGSIRCNFKDHQFNEQILKVYPKRTASNQGVTKFKLRKDILMCFLLNKSWVGEVDIHWVRYVITLVIYLNFIGLDRSYPNLPHWV